MNTINRLVNAFTTKGIGRIRDKSLHTSANCCLCNHIDLNSIMYNARIIPIIPAKGRSLVKNTFPSLSPYAVLRVNSLVSMPISDMYLYMFQSGSILDMESSERL